MGRIAARTHEHAARPGWTRLPRRLRGAVRGLAFRLAHPRVACGRMHVERGAVFDVGPAAEVRIARGVTFGREFTGSFQGRVVIGERVWFGRGCTVSCHADLRIGDGCVFAEHVSVHDNQHRTGPAGVPIAERGYAAAPVDIGERVWIGAKATVLAGVRIGDDAVVAAGAVVLEDVPAGATVAGVPARVVGGRPSA